RVVRAGYAASWSPDGTKLAYSTGTPGFSGLAILDLETGERKLLAVPGEGPVWSPDGRYIVYNRQRKIMTSAMLADQTLQPEAFDVEELCLIRADGTEEPRPLVGGYHPQWGESGEFLYYQSHSGLITMRISIGDENAQPEPVVMALAFQPDVSPDGRYIAEAVGELQITDIATGEVVETWRGPLWSHYAKWSADGHQLAMFGWAIRQTGLWMYDRRTNEGHMLIDGPVGSSGGSPDGRRFELGIGFPYVEIWVVDIPEGSSLQEVFGPGATVQEYGQALIDYYDKAIEAAPDYTELYLRRAEQALWLYGEQGASAYLHDFELALSRCDCATFSLVLHIWFKYCWPPSERCRIMSPLAIILAEKVGWSGLLGLAHYRAGHWEKTAELTRLKIERSEAN
ncbi:MAG: PD40 domain-containing protein, partial [Phycisphaerales bacterium]